MATTPSTPTKGRAFLPPSPLPLLPLIAILIASLSAASEASLSEVSRLAEYKRRNHTWPLRHCVPDTPGWTALQNRRFEQVRRVPDNTERYNGWLHSITSAFVAPNFTENGWGLTRAPPDLVEELKRSLHEGLPNARTEKKVDAIEGSFESRPLFVRIGQLSRKTLETLKPMHEEWAGVPLSGALAYGLRAYRNNSNLLMHVDKPITHIISCILHVDHSEDSEPWPILIEDFQGNTNEVILESGDMLFYESSKCMHGRPRNFTGSWYSSIFVHYYPVGWDTETRNMESHYAVPPEWSHAAPPSEDVDWLVIVGTSFKEPDCEDLWCNFKNSVKWNGPAPEGVVVTTGYDPDDPSTFHTAGAYKPVDDGRDEL